MSKYIVLCIAGQSNAIGYDESVIDENYIKKFNTNRIFQLGFFDDKNLQIIPLNEVTHSFQDMRPFSNPSNYLENLGTKGIQLPLANLLLKYIPEDYKILVVTCAYGGTGFLSDKTGIYDSENLKPINTKYWGVESPFYLALKDRLEYVLNLNENNLFLGTIWIQGENDFENSNEHCNKFKKMTDDFFLHFKNKFTNRVYKGNWDKNIWYNVETVSYWYEYEGCKNIWENYKNWNLETYVPIPKETYSNAINGTGITSKNLFSHFGNNSFVDVVSLEVIKAISKRFV